mmetsp:Transcript_11620/g.28639  ORF Transcript_11620/g.28639 Transcript_11620/m.28639 type:complete len:315 (+) Transcript_11620:129-1073(+)
MPQGFRRAGRASVSGRWSLAAGSSSSSFSLSSLASFSPKKSAYSPRGCTWSGKRTMSWFYPRMSPPRKRAYDITQNIVHSGLPLERFKKDRLLYRFSSLKVQRFLRVAHKVTGITAATICIVGSQSSCLADTLHSASPLSVVLCLSIMTSRATHQIASRYVRRLLLCAGGKQVEICTTTWAGGLRVERIPLVRIEMTPRQWLRGQRSYYYGFQWKDQYGMIGYEDEDTLVIARNEDAEFVDLEGLQYVFGRCLKPVEASFQIINFIDDDDLLDTANTENKLFHTEYIERSPVSHEKQDPSSRRISRGRPRSEKG